MTRVMTTTMTTTVAMTKGTTAVTMLAAEATLLQEARLLATTIHREA
jgi:hypothetical protein